jgi:adenosylcobinamide-GDP ribazoletransferase
MELKDDHSSGSLISKCIAFCTALRFLTVIPVSWQVERDGDYFQQSIYSFPLIGILIGCGGMALATVAGQFLPPLVTAFLLLFYLSAISGFLHLDGVADSADGLLSARPREQSLEIMKDSRTGAMGVVMLVCVMLGKFAALSSLSFELLLTAVLIMPIAGRCAILITMATRRYARPEGGIGGLFYSTRARKAASIGCVILVSICLLVAGWRVAVLVSLMVLLTVSSFSSFCEKRLGGVTGDTLGATCELTEMVVAIGLTAMV